MHLKSLWEGFGNSGRAGGMRGSQTFLSWGVGGFQAKKRWEGDPITGSEKAGVGVSSVPADLKRWIL
ncbi:MAG: hypothetical protein STSR0009_19770 [Methanoregula sp.]